MKLLILFLSFVSIVATALGQPKKATVPVSKPATDPSKKAFIVAISNYHPSTGWEWLNCANDLSMARNYLKNQGFSTIVAIEDQKATKAGIVTALKLFIDQCQVGDKVIIHFSGHGIQVTDLSGDEADGYDESLVCYDSPSRNIDSTYDGSKHLLDDEWNSLITQLRAKLGSNGHVLAVIDACHSGTISRGAKPTVKIRGGLPPIVLQGMRKRSINNKPNETTGFNENSTNSNTLAKYVCLGGAPSHKNNNEIRLTDSRGNTLKDVGSLTYGVNIAFSKLKSKNITYRQFYSQALYAEKAMDDHHQPIVEGDVDNLFFGGDYRAAASYYTVSEIDVNRLVLPVGMLAGVYAQSKVSVCKIGAEVPTSDNTLATGTISKVTETTAEVILTKDIVGQKAGQLVVFVTEESDQHLNLKLFMGNLADSTQKRIKQEVSKLSKFSSIEWAKTPQNADLLIKVENDSLQFYDAKIGLPYASRCANKTEEIRNRLLVFSQIKYWLGVSVQNPEFEGEMQLSNGGNCNFLSKEEYNKVNTGVLQVLEGDPVCLFIKNHHPQSGSLNPPPPSRYFTILEFSPNQEVRKIYPQNGQPEVIKDIPVQLWKNNTFTLNPNEKEGIHIVKLFITEQPLPIDEKLLSIQKEIRSRGIGDDKPTTLPPIYTQTIVYNLQRPPQ